jgi:hypothetical protein
MQILSQRSASHLARLLTSQTQLCRLAVSALAAMWAGSCTVSPPVPQQAASPPGPAVSVADPRAHRRIDETLDPVLGIRVKAALEEYAACVLTDSRKEELSAIAAERAATNAMEGCIRREGNMFVLLAGPREHRALHSELLVITREQSLKQTQALRVQKSRGR